MKFTKRTLLVGEIGITNIMMVSVTEDEGNWIRLAVGVTESDVQMQFLSEAIVISLIGGALGIFSGIAGSYVLRSTLH